MSEWDLFAFTCLGEVSVGGVSVSSRVQVRCQCQRETDGDSSLRMFRCSVSTVEAVGDEGGSFFFPRIFAKCCSASERSGTRI